MPAPDRTPTWPEIVGLFVVVGATCALLLAILQ
jgi:hypothetical protein